MALDSSKGGQSEFRHIRFVAKNSIELEELWSPQFAKVSIKPHKNGVEPGMVGTFGSVPGLSYLNTSVSGGFDTIPDIPFDALFFTFPFEGRQTIETRRGAVDAPESAASYFDGLDLSRIRDGDGRRHTTLIMDRRIVALRLSRLLDRAVTRPVQFDAVTSSDVTYIQRFSSFAHSLPMMELGNLAEIVPSLNTRMPEIAADIALAIWPNSYSHLLIHPPARIAPRQVKIAIDYIREHPNTFASPDFLADLAGVSLRALQYSFQNFVGMGINEYQRCLRLQHARQQLLGQSSRSMAEIGKSCGFINPTSFSRAFKAAFGVSPSSLKNKGESQD